MQIGELPKQTYEIRPPPFHRPQLRKKSKLLLDWQEDTYMRICNAVLLSHVSLNWLVYLNSLRTSYERSKNYTTSKLIISLKKKWMDLKESSYIHLYVVVTAPGWILVTITFNLYYQNVWSYNMYNNSWFPGSRYAEAGGKEDELVVRQREVSDQGLFIDIIFTDTKIQVVPKYLFFSSLGHLGLSI